MPQVGHAQLARLFNELSQLLCPKCCNWFNTVALPWEADFYTMPIEICVLAMYNSVDVSVRTAYYCGMKYWFKYNIYIYYPYEPVH